MFFYDPNDRDMGRQAYSSSGSDRNTEIEVALGSLNVKWKDDELVSVFI